MYRPNMDYLLFVFIVVIGVGCVVSELSLRFVFIVESQERDLTSAVQAALRAVEGSARGEESARVALDEDIVLLDRERPEESYRMLCGALAGGASAVLDLSWAPWRAPTAPAPLVRAPLGPQQLLAAVDEYLAARNATDAAILLETEAEVDQALYFLLGRSALRVWSHAGLSRASARALAAMRPPPQEYVLVGAAAFLADTYARAAKEGLVRRPHRWHLVCWERGGVIDPGMLLQPAITLSAAGRDDCGPDCSAGPRTATLTSILRHLVSLLSRLEPPHVLPAACRAPPPGDAEGYTTSADYATDTDPNNSTARPKLYELLEEDSRGNDSDFLWDEAQLTLQPRLQFTQSVASSSPAPAITPLARWRSGERYRLLPGAELPKLKMFFRIGTAPAVPWTMVTSHPVTGEPVYTGYCIDLIDKLAETMDFDYELVIPKRGTFGARQADGTWDGLVGDLVRGETDMAVAALTMTAEREEVIDFVPPYYDQTGILIVIRKQSRKSSLFKFMTVLRGEVWASVVAALLLTGTLVWLLDKYSPYSAANNPGAYPYPCREFTLKESFWFALTSFTPQGGGEAPKALSGRTLVAAYWLFVVLMLATFTANLAAFLTVERMQSPVSSLEQLARQSRINYTVVEGSDTHRYFINMKFAEDTLYRVWKEITLNASSDQAQYRVWDYPVREQYGHILLAINASGPVADARAGFDQVNAHTDADFAFIHDAAEIRYELSRNCNLTEVGAQFAEQPYALAVAQGSRLQERLSRALLMLQKGRQLEALVRRYWNESARQACPDADESEGITLESLGGVFIATLFGLGLAMLTLAWEVFYYKRKEKNKVLTIDNAEKSLAVIDKKTLGNKMAAGVAKLRKRKGGKVKKVTIGDSFKPAGDKMGVSYISVYPKREYRP